MAEQQKRQVAYKTRIADLISSRYIKEEGWTPNYVETKGRKISRANIIGVVVSKEDVDNFQSLLIDDGTGKISARSFEKNPIIEGLDIGDIVLIIGRPREYSGERYLLIEIIRKIEDKRWILYRKAELESESPNKYPEKEEIKEKDEELSEEIIVDSSAEKIISRIKALDKGEGADIDEVIKGIENGEKTIASLLSEGEIFEIKPGKLKVLE